MFKELDRNEDNEGEFKLSPCLFIDDYGLCNVVAPQWILTSSSLPEHGQLIVKYWSATKTTWAGRHISHAKHESFDKWYALPEPI